LTKPTDKLTILLLTKDRFEFSKRWLKYATLNQQKFPIVVADGSSEDLLRHEIERISMHLDIKYLYPGPDLSISHFISKTISSLRLIQTRYTFMASDDDFYFDDALEKSVDFLESKDGFILCNGGALDFGLSVRPTSKNSIFGEIRYVRKFGLYECYLEADPAKRITQYRKTDRSYWHSVITTESLLRSWEMAAELKLTRYDTLEDFLNLYWLTQGKFMNLDNEILLFHQVHNSMISQTLESDSARENSEIWKAENRIVEDYIASIIEGELIRREHSLRVHQSIDLEDSFLVPASRRLRNLIFTLYKKIEYKVGEKLKIEPKMTLTGLQIPELTLSQIKVIQNFLNNRKNENFPRRHKPHSE
jgi:glycosyltransferase domain-containing protein